MKCRRCVLAPLAASLAAGCVPPAGDDTPGPVGAHLAVVTTTDYQVGSLATVDLDSGAISDELIPTSADPAVFVLGGKVWQVGRSESVIRRLAPEDLRAPELEFSTGAGSNPRALALCGERLFAALFERSYIAIYDPETGIEKGKVDLAPWADEDGLPEAQSLVVVEGKLYASLGRLDRRTNPWSATEDGGAVLTIDCAAGEVTDAAQVGPDAFIVADPSRPGGLLVTEGVYYGADFQPALDGGLRRMDTLTGAVETPLVTELALGGNFFGVAGVQEGFALLVSVTDQDAEFYCVDLRDGAAQRLATTPSFVPQVVANRAGEVWATVRAPYLDPAAGGSLRVFDPRTCTEKTPSPAPTFSLDPFSLAFVE